MGARNTLETNQPLKKIEIIWVDSRVNNKENQSYKNNLLKDKDILRNMSVKISLFEKVSDALEYLKQLEFVTTLIICSGILYPEFIKTFKTNIKDFSICPKILIFCGNAKKYLDRNKNEADLLLNHSFYNSGGVKDKFLEVKDFLKDYSIHIEPTPYENKSEIDDKFKFESIWNEGYLILPLFFYNYLPKPNKENILALNLLVLSFFANIKELKVLFEQISEVKDIPYEILCKYWLKAYSYDNDFTLYINKEIKNNNFIFEKILFEGLKAIKPPLDIENNENLYRYSSLTKYEIDNLDIILSKEKKNIPLLLIYSKNYVTFFFDKKEAFEHSKKHNDNININVLFIIENAKNNLMNCDLYTSLDKYNNTKNNQILFLPYMFFEVLKKEKRSDKEYIIYLGCIEKYKTIFQKEEQQFLLERIPGNSSFSKDIIKYILTDKEYIDIYNILTIEYKNNPSNTYKIFGDIFVDNNKDKCHMIIDGKKLELKEEYTINEQNKNTEKLIIKLIGLKKTNDLSHMFEEVEDLIDIKDFSKIDTSMISDISCMFKNCSKMESLPDISKLNTMNVTDMSHLFYNCSSLKHLPDISKWKTSKVTNMNSLFYGCNNLISLPDISRWDMSNVKNMRFMFYDMNNLESLPNDISNWKTNNVINMSSMFDRCYKIKQLPDISKWNVSKVTDFSYMFHMCKSLESLSPISKWNINQNNVKYDKMFFGLNDSLEIPLNFKKNI